MDDNPFPQCGHIDRLFTGNPGNIGLDQQQFARRLIILQKSNIVLPQHPRRHPTQQRPTLHPRHATIEMTRCQTPIAVVVMELRKIDRFEWLHQLRKGPHIGTHPRLLVNHPHCECACWHLQSRQRCHVWRRPSNQGLVIIFWRLERYRQ